MDVIGRSQEADVDAAAVTTEKQAGPVVGSLPLLASSQIPGVTIGHRPSGSLVIKARWPASSTTVYPIVSGAEIPTKGNAGTGDLGEHGVKADKLDEAAEHGEVHHDAD